MKKLLEGRTGMLSRQKRELANLNIGQLGLPSVRNRKQNEGKWTEPPVSAERQQTCQHTHPGSRRRRGQKLRSRGNIWRSNGQKLPKVDEKIIYTPKQLSELQVGKHLDIILKTARDKQLIMAKESLIRLRLISPWKLWRPESSGMDIDATWDKTLHCIWPLSLRCSDLLTSSVITYQFSP